VQLALFVVLCFVYASAAPLAADSDTAQTIIATVATNTFTIKANSDAPAADYTTCKKLGSGQFKQACMLHGNQVVLLYLTSADKDGLTKLDEEIGKFNTLRTYKMPVPIIYGANAFNITIEHADGKTTATHGYLEQAMSGDVDAATGKICSGFDKSFKAWWDGLDTTGKDLVRPQLEKIYLIYQAKVLVADLQVMVDSDKKVYVVDPDDLCTRRGKLVKGKKGQHLDLKTYPCRQSRNHANTDCDNIPKKYGVTALADETSMADVTTRMTTAFSFVEQSSSMNMMKRWKKRSF